MLFQYLGKVINVLDVTTFTSVNKNTSNTDDKAPTFYNSFYEQHFQR